jgi:hypothetical protein
MSNLCSSTIARRRCRPPRHAGLSRRPFRPEQRVRDAGHPGRGVPARARRRTGPNRRRVGAVGGASAAVRQSDSRAPRRADNHGDRCGHDGRGQEPERRKRKHAGDAVAVFPEGPPGAALPQARSEGLRSRQRCRPRRGYARRDQLPQPRRNAHHGRGVRGSTKLLDSMLRVLRTPGLSYELTILPDLAPIGDRRALARRAQTAVAGVTGVEHGSRPSPAPRGLTPAVASTESIRAAL